MGNRWVKLLPELLQSDEYFVWRISASSVLINREQWNGKQAVNAGTIFSKKFSFKDFRKLRNFKRKGKYQDEIVIYLPSNLVISEHTTTNHLGEEGCCQISLGKEHVSRFVLDGGNFIFFFHYNYVLYPLYL